MQSLLIITSSLSFAIAATAGTSRRIPCHTYTSGAVIPRTTANTILNLLNMKKIFLALLLSLALMPAQAVDWERDTEPAILEVFYTRTQVTDTTKRDTDFYNEETMLRIGKTMSRYCSVPKFYHDSLMFLNPDLYWQMESESFYKDPKEHDRTLLKRHGRYWSFIYKNYPPGKVTETSYFDMEDWRYEEDWEKPQWEVSDSTKEILGYECLMATADYRGRRWIAWFTPEIPIQEGPWKLCGLPGLILEASDTGDVYHFKANGLRQSGIPDVGFLIYREKRGITTLTRDKFFNNWWKYKHSNSVAKIKAAFGVQSAEPTPPVSKKRQLNYDKEETDYPHDL